MLSDKFLEELKFHEGFRKKPYRCTAEKLTIGYGWNLESRPIYEEVAALQLRMQAEECEKELEKALDFYPNLTQPRKEVLINMCLNLGLPKLLEFTNTLRLMRESKHELAAQHMLKSKWAEQVGARARFLSAKYAKG